MTGIVGDQSARRVKGITDHTLWLELSPDVCRELAWENDADPERAISRIANRCWDARVLARARQPDVPHGTVSTYTNHRCRCVECQRAMGAYHRAWRARQVGVPSGVPHGRASTYNHYRCRCRPCKDANAAHQRDLYQRQVARP